MKLTDPVVGSHGVSTDERLKRLEKLDLTNIRRKLMEPEPEGKGWSEAQALEAEKWYRRYLGIIIKYPHATQHVPNTPIDIFWHQHILDTTAYAEDCQYVLSYFLHHYPYFGLNGDADQRDSSFSETNNLYRLMFGEDCTSMEYFSSKKSGVTTAVGCKKSCGAGCRQSNCKGGSR